MRTIKLKLRTPSDEALSAVSPPLSQRRTSRRYYTFAGKTLTLPAWSKELGISAATLRDRIGFFGWPIERALTEPAVKAYPNSRTRRLNRLRIARIAASFRKEAEQ